MKGAPVSAQFSLVAIAAIGIGLADAALIATARLGATGAFEYVPARVWLVSPLCWAIAAAALALPSFALARARGGVVTVVAMLVLLASVRLRFAPPRTMAVVIALTLAGAVVAWLVARRWLVSAKRVPAVLTVAALLVLGAALALSPGEARRPPGRVTAASSDPDVLVVFMDTVPHRSVFTGGTSVSPALPVLSRLASQAIVFDRAYTPSPWTLPAHVSAVTGVPAHRLDVGFSDQRYEGSAPTLAERFRRRGYRTVAVISNAFLNRGSGFTRGFDVYEHAANALDVCRTAPGVLLDDRWPWFAATVCNWGASQVTGRAIANMKDERPLFLLLNYMDAHDPYYVESDCPRPAGANPFPRDTPVHAYRNRYHPSHLAAVRCIDRSLGIVEAALQRRNRELVTVVLADHGEQFGEHGLVRHGNSLYDGLLHVPFMIRGPRTVPRRIAEPVSITALPEVLFGVLDGQRRIPAGEAIVSSLFPPSALRQEEQWSAIAGRWKLMQSAKKTMLFDLVSDPGEERDLARTPSGASVAGQLTASIEREKRSRPSERSSGFRSLGYIR